MAIHFWKRKDKRDKKLQADSSLIGPHVSFAAKEAYKLLRTNLMFSFSNEGEGRVIGITSAVQNEGKSLTSCNIACALAETGAKVLLLDADLRRPTIAAKMHLTKALGITNVLVSRMDVEEVIQTNDVMPGLDVISSGDIPPNPSELLGSNRMGKTIEQLRKKYDYIVVDLPPVTVVSDTLAISKYLDGVVVVVRSGISEKKMLAEAMRQLNMVSVRVLGFVYRADSSGKKPYKKRYYRYYNEYTKKSEK